MLNNDYVLTDSFAIVKCSDNVWDIEQNAMVFVTFETILSPNDILEKKGNR